MEKKFDISKIDLGLTEKAKAIMNMFDDKIFIIEKYCETEKAYDDFIQTIFSTVKEGFEHKEFREHPVKYKFRNDSEEEVKWLQLRHFLINIMFWRPMVLIDPTRLDDHLIIDKTQMIHLNKGFIKNYMDVFYIEPFSRYIPNWRMNEIMCDTKFWLSRISAKFNIVMGLSCNLEVFNEIAERNPELNELMNFKLDEGMQPKEMEIMLKKKTKELTDLIVNDDVFNIMKPLLATGSIKNRQFFEAVSCVGTKPDIEGRTMAKPINTNYMRGGGFRTVKDLYKNSISGKKAAIMNHEYMGKSGHFAMLVSIATSHIRLSKTVEDCGTCNPITIEIKSIDHLKKLNGRRYKFHGQKDYNIINSRNDKFLIGQTVLMRSPITCAAKDGICKECYGELFYTNEACEAVGIFSATEVMNPIMQGVLSAKHHQETSSDMIEFQEDFYRFLDLFSTQILLKSDYDNDVDLSKYTLVLFKDDIKSSDDSEELDLGQGNTDEDDSFSDYVSDDDEDSMETHLPYSTKEFEIWGNMNVKTKEATEVYRFNDVTMKDLFMHKDMLAKMNVAQGPRGRFYYIAMDKLNPEEFIFMIDVKNNELTKPLKEIQALLNNKAHEGCDSYEDMAQKMIDLLIESNISAMALHGEVILRELIRSRRNVLSRPRFDRVVVRDDYTILTISSALTKNPSVTTSIATPYLKKQLTALPMTFEKRGRSVLDPLFRKTLAPED